MPEPSNDKCNQDDGKKNGAQGKFRIRSEAEYLCLCSSLER